jgi:site-specific DNA recombinase
MMKPRSKDAVCTSPYADPRVASYVRMSHDPSGEMLGINRQFDENAALAKRWDWGEIPEHLRFDDNDLSAYSGKRRPGFEDLLAAIARGEVNVVVCWHTDRLYRNINDLLRIIEVGVPRNLVIKPVTGPELDLSTPTGKAIAQILASIAEMESAHKANRQVLANAQRAELGQWSTNNRCFGYTMTGQPLEPEATAFRTAVAEVLAGKSIRAVAAEWNTKGLKTTLAGKERRSNGETTINTGEWNSPRVRRLLMRPRYAGLKVHQGKVIGRGDWTALIDEDTHRGLIAYLSDPARVKNTSFERKYIGSGVYICGRCRGPMRAAFPRGKATARTYECKAHQHVVRRGEPLDEYVEHLVFGYLSEPETRQRLAVMLHGGERVDVDGLHTRRATLQARKDDLAAMFAAGDIDASQLRRGTNDLQTQLAGVDQVLGELSRRSPVADLLAAGNKLRKHWDQLSPDMKGKAVQEICTVTVQPTPRGTRWFTSPDGPTREEWDRFGDYIDIDWKA